MNGLLQDLILCCEVGLVGLCGGLMAEPDVTGRGLLGEVGELGGIGALLGDSYVFVLMCGGVGLSIVRMESASESETPDRVARSEYESSIDVMPVTSDEVDIRIVSVSESVELIVDIVRSEAALESPSEDGANAISCL
jgi:hypothetical protein